MKKQQLSKIFIPLTAVIFLVIGAYCVYSVRNSQQSSSDNKLQIVTSFYPLYFFTQEIAHGSAHITNLTPEGAEPHDYEPSTQDFAKTEKSDLLIINGNGLEPWENKISAKKTVKVSENLTTLKGNKSDGTISDPHIWLDPVLAQQIADRITQALIQVDPNNIDLYIANNQSLKKRLDELDQSFESGLKNCKHHDIITSHAAFGYIAERYGLKQVAIQGISAEEEPSPKQLAEIATFAKKYSIKYVFFETLVNPRLAQTLAQEIGAQTLVFDPLEGLSDEEQKIGVDYFSIQKDNLKSLKIALECE